MTTPLNCDALRDDIMALLYDDGDPSERSRARDHLAQCVPCRTEYADFKGVRKVLSGWSLPAAAPKTQNRFQPAWLPAGLAAAAGLILGIGIAVEGRGVLFPATAPDSAAKTETANPAPGRGDQATQFVSYADLQELLKTQETRHQAEIADLRRSILQVSASSPAPAASTNPGQAGSSALSATTIERLLRASEERQAKVVEARLAGLRTENDLQRQYDMAQIAAGLAYIDSRTGADAARTSELMKNLVRVTAKPQDR